MGIRGVAKFAALAFALVLTGCGGGSGRQGSDLSVTGSGPSSQLATGDIGTFTMTVTNAGDSDASDVTIVDQVGNGLALTGVTCAASGGATCPSSLTASMTVSTLPVGGALVFTVSTVVTQTGSSAATLTNTMTADYSGDVDRSNNSATITATGYTAHADLSVSGSGPASSVQPGQSISFTMTVVNAGPDAAGQLQVQDTMTGLSYTGMTCQAIGDVACPAQLGPAMSVASMPAGASLVFTVSATVPFSTTSGTATNGMSVKSSDATSKGDSAVVSVAVGASTPSGAYKLYAADGRVYDLAIDFTARTYTVSASGQTVVQRSFADADSNGDYVVSGQSRLRVATDLVVGNDDFGHGLVPYIAARHFVTGQVAGPFDLATRDIAADGTTSTHAGTAYIESNLIQICQSDADVYRAQQCPSSDGAKSYWLAASGDQFTATDVSSGAQFQFRVALSGGATILLATAPGTDGSQELRIGLRDGAAIAGGTQRGGTTNAEWVSTTLSTDDFLLTHADGSVEEGVPTAIDSGAIYSMRLVSLGTQQGFDDVYVLQEFPITVVVGDNRGSASGLLQIELP